MGQSLPHNPYLPDSLNCDAYERCLRLETGGGGPQDSQFSWQMCGRILGYMMLEAPTDQGRANVRKEIASCETDEALQDLARLYATIFLSLMKKLKPPTSASFSPSPRTRFDETQERIVVLLQLAPESDSALKELALKRDGYRCIVSRLGDMGTFMRQSEFNSNYEPPETGCSYTRAARIFPDSSDKEHPWSGEVLDDKGKYSAASWANVRDFGLVQVPWDPLGAPQIHRVENIMTMCVNTYEMFDMFSLWFGATDNPNTYTTHSSHPFLLTHSCPPIPPIITFTSTNPDIPVPNSDYLRIHAACAKVAHHSGATTYFHTIIDEWEDKQVLASDGGSADMFSFLLARRAS